MIWAISVVGVVVLFCANYCLFYLEILKSEKIEPSQKKRRIKKRTIRLGAM